MTPPQDHVDAEFGWDHLQETHDIMYVVKRSAYEFCLAVPRKQVNPMVKKLPLLQMRFKGQYQMPAFVLEPGEIEDFWEGLSRLMEYMRVEEIKRAGQL